MKFILLTLFTGLLFLGQAQQIDSKTKKKLDKLINEQLAEKIAPGLAIGIIQNGAIIYESYAGYADLKKKTSLSKESRFNYASSGKQFTALAVLTLIEEGKINLEDDIRKFLPDFYPDINEEIQIQHLITHTSGIRDVYELWNLQGITWWEETLSNQDAIDMLMKQQQLSFEPGSKHIYSNSNYLLLTEIIKQVTSKSFKDYSDDLFNNLGMTSTGFEPDHTDIPRRVLPYGFWKKYRMYEWNTDLIGDGALFTTLPDQLAWEVMIQQQESDFLTAKTMEKSQSPIVGTFEGYGYGLEFEDGRSFHHGSTGAYGATFARYTEENLTIVVMTNYTNILASYVTEQCYQILTGAIAPSPKPRKPQTVEAFVSIDSLLGTYKTPGGYYYRFVMRSDTLFLERADRNPVAIEHEEGNIYHEINDPAFQQAFTIDPKLGMQITAYYPTHDSYTLTKEDITWEGYDYEKLNGTYYNSELDVRLEVKYVKDKEYLVTKGQNEYSIQIFEPDVFWFGNYRAKVGQEDTRVSELLLNSNRNRNVLFTRTTE
ncbi:MAG: serine hydrolase domain-containing protein [Ekhidna sp.]